MVSIDHFDLRHTILVLVNILKSGIGPPWQWDPFNVVAVSHQFTLMEASILLFMFIFSVTSVKIRARSEQWQICIRVGNFSTTLTLSLLVCLVVPQCVFWYAYPMILLISMNYTWLAKTFNTFLDWLQGMSPSMPVFNIFVVTTLATAGLNHEDQQPSSGHEAV